MKYMSNSLIIWRSLIQAQAGPQREKKSFTLCCKALFVGNQVVSSVGYDDYMEQVKNIL